MGTDITEIAQKVLDNNINAANVFRKMYDLHYNPNPLDVPLEYIDENGNKVTTNVPNRSKIKADFDSWRESVLNIYDTIRPIDKVTIQPQGQDGDNAVFFMPEIADGYCYALIFQVNVSGDADATQYADVEIQYYNAGNGTYYHLTNTLLDGRDWNDNYKDFNVIPINKTFIYGNNFIKIINQSDKTIEIFAIGAKVSKTDIRPTN